MRLFFATLLVVFVSSIGVSQENYLPSESNLKAREWFEDARFGMFIHWGVYSVLGDGEWVMYSQNIGIEQYEKLPSFFNPVKYDPVAWVKMAKAAGMKYITITSRHHDGFSMFDTKATDYNIVKKTPYGKDVLKALSEACRQEGIKLFFYYSLLDWRDDNYFPRGKLSGKMPGRSESGDWNKYIAFMKVQLTELLTNYGEIGGIWFDGHWDQKLEGMKGHETQMDWHYDELYTLIHDLQPQALIGNNHHLAPIKGEDFQMFEKDLPGKNTTGFGTSSDDIGRLPLEVCETINRSWGFNLQDDKHKSPKELIQYVVNAAGYGSNLLLNVGPMPNGEIQKEHIESLKKVGEWMGKNGETIYGTTAGPVNISNEIVSTRKGNVVYLHVLNPNEELAFLEGFKEKVKSVSFYESKNAAKYELNKYGLFVRIPDQEKNDIDCIIQIDLK